MEKDSKILVDTSILIALQLGDQFILHYLPRLGHRLIVPRIVTCEFIHGSRNAKEKRVNHQFIEQLPIIELSDPISRLSYQLTYKYCLKIRFGIADALIAATAITQKLPLWTTNQKHFKPITELKLFNPSHS